MPQKNANMASSKLNVDLTDSFEKIPVKICSDSKSGSKFVAQEIANLIREKQSKKEECDQNCIGIEITFKAM